MIRVRAYQGRPLPAVSLYRDDLDRIVEILRAGSKSFEIRDDEFKYDSLDEMRGRVGTNPSCIQLRGFTPAVFVTIRRFGFPGVHVFRGDEPEAEAPYLQVRDILERRVRLLSRVFDLRVWPALLVGVLLLSAVANSNVTSASPRLLVVALICAALLSLVLKTGSLSVISLTRRHETDTFWRRHVEKLLIASAGAIIGIVFKSLWDWVLSHNLFKGW